MRKARVGNMAERPASESGEEPRPRPRLDDIQRMVFETSSQGIWVLDSEGRTVFLNGRMADMLGYDPAELRHLTFFDLTESDRVPAAVAAIPRRPLPAREVHELRFRHRSGRAVEARVTTAPLCSGWDEPVGALAMVDDLTELRAAEARAEEATRRFDRMAHTLPDCLWYARRSPAGEKVIEYVSPSCERVWGVPSELVKQDADALTRAVVDEDRAAAEAQVATACASGKPEMLVYRVRRPDGSVAWIEDLVVPERTEPDGSCHLTGLARDITDRRRLEWHVTERQREQSLSLLAGGIAHDFNNILMAILGQTSVVRRILDADARGQAELRVVEQAAKRAADLCRQLLAYAGRGRFEVTPTDLSELVSDMRGLMKAVVPKEVDLEFRLTQELPLVDVDTTQMRQVIMNVVANAGEAMRTRGGTMTITVSATNVGASTDVAGNVRDPLRPGEYITLCVEDRGCGMSEDVLARIFDPFFTTKAGGHGLGLAAVLGIVRGHEGSVGVESALDRGTTFTIHLPASATARQERRVPSAPPPTEENSESVRVLVVEDEPTVRNIVQRMLELSGHEVVLAEDGVEGLERFRASPEGFDLAVLDLTMPRMNGIETMRALRELDPSLPILITSGHAEEDSVQRVIRESELAAFIQKPYRYGELMGKIRQLLAKADRSAPSE